MFLQQKLHQSLLLAILITIIIIVPPVSEATLNNPNLYSTTLNGVFYNLSFQTGGTVTVDLDLHEDNVLGLINFTQLPGDTRPLCGAGDLSGTRTENTILASFTSEDTDPGCGFDHGGIFMITGTLDLDATHFYGAYDAKNSDESRLREAVGVFETWPEDQQPSHTTYVGTFFNTRIGQEGSVIIDLITGTNTVSGFINFTNYSDERTLCGAGAFTGVRRDDNTLQFSFASSDPDTGCGFDRGLRFILDAAFTEEMDIISGTYDVGTRREGTFNVKRAHIVHLPLINK
jgi:hypothetical protein